MRYLLTEAVERALAEAARLAAASRAGGVTPWHVLRGLACEPETRAGALLAAAGESLTCDPPMAEQSPSPLPDGTSGDAAHQPAEEYDVPLRLAMVAAAEIAEATRPEGPSHRPPLIATEHLLAGLIAVDLELADWLERQGVSRGQVEATARRGEPPPESAVPLDIPDEGPNCPKGDHSYAKGDPNFPKGDHGIANLGNGPQASPVLPPGNVRTADAAPPAVKTRSPVGQTPLPISQELWPLLRIVDAALNRAREGLRVLEDFVRFVLDDRFLTGQFKQLRHTLAEAFARLPGHDLLATRETQADVGTATGLASEVPRHHPDDVVSANFKRVQESLRSLEEFTKPWDHDLARTCQEARYHCYTLERALAAVSRGSRVTSGPAASNSAGGAVREGEPGTTEAMACLPSLAGARLYVLVDGGPSPEAFEQACRELLAGGAQVVQLRDKHLPDRELLQRAVVLRRLTARAGALLIVNDRPDLALLSHADGVHVGQDELQVRDARRIVGPRRLVGVSTHSLQQARQAVLEGADYIGVGPTFPSSTKSFAEFPGLALLSAVAAEIRLPAFAIGGIEAANLHEVLATGFRRVAVSGAVSKADDPRRAAAELLAMLRAAG